MGRPSWFAEPAPDLDGHGSCRAGADSADEWLAELFGQARAAAPAGKAALVAVGGYGRSELAPQSDLDVVLVHDGKADPAPLAEMIWYPVWDAGMKLGHQVLTPRQAQSLASGDLDTATSMLSARHICGKVSLSEDLAARAHALWRKRRRRWLPELDRRNRERHATHGEVAFLLEPDIKSGRGGLRDVQAIWWAGEAMDVTVDGDAEALESAYSTLLRVRVALGSVDRRLGDRLVLEAQDRVADALGTDADRLMAEVASAARTISWHSDELWSRVRSALEGPPTAGGGRERRVADGVVLRDGEVHLESDAPCDAQAALAVAIAAADSGLRIERKTLQRLADAPAPPEPWPISLREALVELLAKGRPAVEVIESLDRVGIWASLLPEWEAVRCLPQRNAYHTFTVDRHLCETAANAAELAGSVERPDLLLLGALLHDIGKGGPGDHTEEGMEIVGVMGPRLGLPDSDVAVLRLLVEHHLLLPDVATRRDLDDPDTISHVAACVGDSGTLELLGALTRADSLATGPAAWSDWKAELVELLVERTAKALAGGEPAGSRPDAALEFDSATRRISAEGEVLSVTEADRPGLLAQVTGVLALHGLDVLTAEVRSGQGPGGEPMAAETFRVSCDDPGEIAWESVIDDIHKALDGRLAVTARLAERSRRYRRAPVPGVAEPAVRFDNEMSSVATVIEVVAPDEVGTLAGIARALAEFGVDVRSARVQTLGPQVVDAFYVVGPDGDKLTGQDQLEELRRALGHAVGI